MNKIGGDDFSTIKWEINGEIVSINDTFNYIFPNSGIYEVSLSLSSKNFFKKIIKSLEVASSIDTSPQITVIYPTEIRDNEEFDVGIYCFNLISSYFINIQESSIIVGSNTDLLFKFRFLIDGVSQGYKYTSSLTSLIFINQKLKLRQGTRNITFEISNGNTNVTFSSTLIVLPFYPFIINDINLNSTYLYEEGLIIKILPNYSYYKKPSYFRYLINGIPQEGYIDDNFNFKPETYGSFTIKVESYQNAIVTSSKTKVINLIPKIRSEDQLLDLKIISDDYFINTDNINFHLSSFSQNKLFNFKWYIDGFYLQDYENIFNVTKQFDILGRHTIYCILYFNGYNKIISKEIEIIKPFDIEISKLNYLLVDTSSPQSILIDVIPFNNRFPVSYQIFLNNSLISSTNYIRIQDSNLVLGENKLTVKASCGSQQVTKETNIFKVDSSNIINIIDLSALRFKPKIIESSIDPYYEFLEIEFELENESLISNLLYNIVIYFKGISDITYSTKLENISNFKLSKLLNYSIKFELEILNYEGFSQEFVLNNLSLEEVL